MKKNRPIRKSLSLSIAQALLILFVCTQIISAQTSWVQKVSGGGLGNPFFINPQNDNVIYSACGDNILRISRDRGNTWQNLSTVPGGSQIKSVTVNARDTNTIVVSMEAGPPDKILKTTNNGTTWTVTLERDFYYWGIPVAHIPNAVSDTLYTMGGNTIFRSVDFGSTWDSLRYNPFGTSGNQGWEYCVVRPDSHNILLLANNANGIWKSTDYGMNWRIVHSAGGEVPALAVSKDAPRTIYGTHWSGGGGFVKSTDGGETWNYSAPLNGINMWNVAVSTTNPNFLITGTYGPSYSTTGGIYISRDAGTTWQRTYQGLQATTNYGCLVIDTLSLFVLQGDGIFRYNYPSGSLTVTSPNGGELWHAYSTHNITWNASGITNVKLEYSSDNGSSWNTITASVPAINGSYPWQVPDMTTSNCIIRVSNSTNSSMNDQSDAVFGVDRLFINLFSPIGGEKWIAGSTHSVQWNSAGVLNIKVQFSTDNGSNWMEASPSMHASLGAYSWKVPHTTSTNCKIKVVNIASPDVYDMSDSAFAIEDTVQFLTKIMVSDNGSFSDTLQFGEKAFATDGIDTAFGEHELTLKPPPGTFDVRWLIGGTNGTKLDLRDTLSLTHPTIIFSIDIQPSGSGYPITLHWNSESFPPDYFTLRDAGTQGELLSIDMLAETTCTITNPAITSVQVVHSLLMSLAVDVNSRWNLVSIPLKVEDRSKATLFPDAISNAFEYTYKYHPTDSLIYGKGYWLKFNSAQTMLLSGRQRLTDSVAISAGWNIIGSLSKSIPVSAITTFPAGILASSFFGYSAGYSEKDTLEPGVGYWVKASQSGWLILNSLSATKLKNHPK